MRRALIALLVLGISLRVYLGFRPLWLDEIWSLLLLEAHSSLFDIFRNPHDNIHLLFSLWMHAVSSDAPPVIVRLPTLVASTLSLVLVYRWLNQGFGVAFWVILALHPIFVLAGFEARGYGLAVLFFLLLLHNLSARQQGTEAALMSALWAFLSILSHPSFAPATLGVLLSALLSAKRAHRMVSLKILLSVTVGTLMLYALYFGRLEIGGGPRQSSLQALLEILSVIFVGPEPRGDSLGILFWALFSSLLVLATAVWSLRIVQQRGDSQTVNDFLIGAVLFPIGLAVVMQHDLLAPRYFLPSAILLFVAFSRAWQAAPHQLFPVLVSSALIVNLWMHFGRFVEHAPASAHQVYEHLCLSDPTARVAASQPFRAALYTQWQNRMNPECSLAVAISESDGVIAPLFLKDAFVWLEEGAAHWYVQEDHGRDVHFVPTLELQERDYELRFTAPHGYLQGSWLGLYVTAAEQR